MTGPRAILTSAAALAALCAGPALATYTERNVETIVLVSTGTPHYVGRALTVEAEVDGVQRAVPVAVEADPFPYDDAWVPVGGGLTSAETEHIGFRHRPRLSTRYRVTNQENGRQVAVTVPVALRKSVRTRCATKDQFDPRRVPCTFRVDVRGPVAGRRIRISIYRGGGAKASPVRTLRLRRVSGTLHRVTWTVRKSRFDDASVCLLGTRDDGYEDADPAPDDKDCTFDIGF